MLIMEITVYGRGQLTRRHAMVAMMRGPRHRPSAPAALEVRSASLGDAASDTEVEAGSWLVVSEI